MWWLALGVEWLMVVVVVGRFLGRIVGIGWLLGRIVLKMGVELILEDQIRIRRGIVFLCLGLSGRFKSSVRLG